MTCPACRTPNDDAAISCAACGSALMPSMLATLKPGALVASRYEVMQFVGKGGMGVVVKARDRALDEVVALKVLRADLAESTEMDRRFRTEIKLARRVRHRNVCGIHEYGEDRGLRFISMEFIEGTDLRQILRETGGPLPHEAYEIVIQACEGLQAIHEAGIIHRDLKTSNIMRDQRGFVRLMDFGIAKDSSADMTAGATGTGQLIGTPEYMSPEQIRGDKLDFRSEIYSMGIVMFEVFTGRLPFQGDTPIATILKHLQEPPPLDGPEAARVPPELIPVLARALAKDRTAHQGSVPLLLEDLHAARTASFPDGRGARGTGAVTRPPAPRSQPASARVTAVPTTVPTLESAAPPAAPQSARRVGRPALPAAGSGASAVPWAVWIGVPVLSLAAAGGAFVAIRLLDPAASATSASGSVAVSSASAPLPPTAAPVTSPPATTAMVASPAPASRRAAPPAPAEPSREAGAPSSELAELDRVAAADPEAALAQASTLAGRHPGDAVLQQRLGRYRAAESERALSRAREMLARAESAPALDAYLEASRLFSRTLDVDPGNLAAREGLARAIRGEERLRARLTQVSFTQGGTDVSGAPATDLPPGLAAPPPGSWSNARSRPGLGRGS